MNDIEIIISALEDLKEKINFDHNKERFENNTYKSAINYALATIKERQADKDRIKELEEYKKIAKLTKISCCTAQNCEALNNAIKEGLENQKLKVELDNKDKIIDILLNEVAKEGTPSEFEYRKKRILEMCKEKEVRRVNKMEENMIRGAILAMSVDNDMKTKLFNYMNNLEEMKVEHKIMKRILVKNGLWEQVLNDDEFIEYLED